MKTAKTHSHLNGLEFLLVHKQYLWREIQEIVKTIDPEDCKTRFSKEKRMRHPSLYSPADINPCFRRLLIQKGWRESKVSYYIRDRVAIEFQFGKYSLAASDLFVNHLAFYIGDEIDVGIEILPMKSLQSRMSSGPAYYEGEIYNVVRQGRGVPAVPLVIIGLEA